MQRLPSCVLLILALLVGACSSPAELTGEAGEVSFSSILKKGAQLPASGTYAFARGSGVRWSDESERIAVDLAFREAFDGAMIERRFRRVTTQAATLRIAFVIGLDEELEPDEMPDRFGLSSDWVPDGLDKRYEQGSILVLVADGLSGELLWRGALTGATARKARIEDRLERTRELARRLVDELPLGAR